jgi:hypothetical protein
VSDSTSGFYTKNPWEHLALLNNVDVEQTQMLLHGYTSSTTAKETVCCLILSNFQQVCYRYQIPEDWPYQEARRMFKEPNATIDIHELKWTAPDEEVHALTLLSNFIHTY